MATYLVAGCAGFIGSRVTEKLLADGEAVIGIDNLNNAYDNRLKDWRLERLLTHKNFQFHRLDICHQECLGDLFPKIRQSGVKKLDAVINLAARAGVRPSVLDPWSYLETNTTGTVNLLEFCKSYDIPKFVIASSSSLYGKDNPMPYREDANTDFPLSPYAASKKAAEVYSYTYHYLYGIDVTIYRYFTVYGPAGRPDMSPLRFVQWINEERPVTIFGDGSQMRDFTYVDDIARGTIAGLRSLGCEVINLGSDAPVALMEMICTIERLTGKKARLEFGASQRADMQATWADISKAHRLLDWQPQTTLEAGLEQLVDWYQENREWAKEIVTG